MPHHLFYFYFNDPATTEIYTLSLHDALPISTTSTSCWFRCSTTGTNRGTPAWSGSKTTEHSNSVVFEPEDRKSTRLNSSHRCISYAVFCLKKKRSQAKR